MNQIQFKLHRVTLPGNIDVQLVDVSDSETIPYIVRDINKEQDVFLNLLNPKVILDLGAHVGMCSILLSKLYPEAKIYSVEPMPLTFEMLKENISLNNCKNITPLNFAVSHNSEDMRMNYPDGNTGGASHVFGYTKSYFPVKSKTLSQIIQMINEPLIDFMKVDIETGEYTALGVFNEWEKIKDIYIELHALFPYHPVCWNEFMNKVRNTILSAPIKGKATVLTPDGFYELKGEQNVRR